MTKSKNTKRALLMSVLSMMLCMAMLIGSTFAWFTDSVTSGKNKVVAGNLDVELYVKDGSDYTPVTDQTNLFMEDAIWEPGHVEVVNLKIANLGTLALQYKLGINIVDEKGGVNVYGDDFKLSDFIKFALIDGEQNFGAGGDGRAAAVAAADKKAVKLSELAVDENGKLYPAGTEGKDSERFVTLVVYMPTDVDNKANYRGNAPEIDLGVTLVATQTPYESDSLGIDYDENAWLEISAEDNGNGTYESNGQLYVKYNGKYKAVTESNTAKGMYTAEDGDKYVTNATAFVAAAKEGGNTTILQDFETIGSLSANRVYLTAYTCDKDIAFDFDGNTVTYNEMNYNSPIEIGTGKKAVLENGTVRASGTMSSSYALVKVKSKTNATLNNLTIDASNTGSGAAFSIIDMGTSATITNSTLIGSVNALNVNNETTLTMSNCTVSGLLYVDRGTVYIASGDYSQMTLETKNTCHITIESGTFGFDPSDYTTNTVYDNGDGTWTVSLIDKGDFEDPFGD